MTINNNDKGFTLVELMIALAMSGIMVAAIYAAYTLQKKTYHNQDQVIVMQQNIRAGLDAMIREFRMAGYDPTDSAGATIVAANRGSIQFTMDITDTAGNDTDGDGLLDGPNENISYGFTLDDIGGDGVVDSLAGVPLKRRTGGAGIWQPMAENIEAIEFFYTLKDGVQTTTPTNDQLDEIRTVQISVLAIAGQRDAKYINNIIYTPASCVVSPATCTPWDLGAGAGNPPGDNFRRRLLIMTVQCRNMGLQE